MGKETAGGSADDDPFEALRRAGFFEEQGAPREPSAEERARLAARRSREADLQRRLEEEAAHIRALTERDRRLARTAKIPGVSAARRRRSTRRVAAEPVERDIRGAPITPMPSAPQRRKRRQWRPANLIAPGLLVVVLGAAWYSQNDNGSATAVVGATPTQRPANYPPIEADASPTPLGTPPPAPASPGAFEFTALHDGSDEPVTWDPCRPVRYVINPAGAPPGTEDLIHEAISRTAAATGLVFEYVGPTDEPAQIKQREPYQPDRYDDRWAPMLIAWSNEQEQPGLAGYIAGLGGPSAQYDSSGRPVYVTGGVLLDAADLGPATALPGGAEGVRGVIQHEIGHAIGLDHVADTAQLMHSEGNSGVTDWGTGDLAGLHELGSGECAPDV